MKLTIKEKRVILSALNNFQDDNRSNDDAWFFIESMIKKIVDSDPMLKKSDQWNTFAEIAEMK